MAISIQKTSIEGLTLIHPHVFEDQRGYFIKDFEKSVYEQNGLPILFYECNESKSKKGTIRGLHFQQKFSQGKLIRVTKGAVFDVAVDLRFDSTTFGKWEGFILSEFNHDVLYIPEGFAHGFLLWKMILFSRIDAQISMRQSLIVVLNLMILILILNGHLI